MVSSKYSIMEDPSAIDFLCTQGLKLKPRVCMSESDLIPGYLNKSQVPPKLSLPSKIRYFLSGHFILRCAPAPMPEIPEPTISTSKISSFIVLL